MQRWNCRQRSLRLTNVYFKSFRLDQRYISSQWEDLIPVQALQSSQLPFLPAYKSRPLEQRSLLFFSCHHQALESISSGQENILEENPTYPRIFSSQQRASSASYPKNRQSLLRPRELLHISYSLAQ